MYICDASLPCAWNENGECLCYVDCVNKKLCENILCSNDEQCSTCDHSKVCKYKEKFETMIKEHFPLLCVCQWYKEENHS